MAFAHMFVTTVITTRSLPYVAIERNREVTTRRRVLEVLHERERKGFKPLPVKEREFIFVSWPKVGTHFWFDIDIILI